MSSQSIAAYSFASCGWQLVQAVPLIVWPQAINSLLTVDEAVHTTVVTAYFARTLGFSLLALGLVTVVLTGALPVDSMVESECLLVVVFYQLLDLTLL